MMGERRTVGSTCMAISDQPISRNHLGAARAARATRGLTAVSVASLLSGLVTGPLLAHALGATGRGVLASVLVPLVVAPFIAQLGLGLFAVRASARGVPVSSLVGSLTIPLLLSGGAIALVGEPLATALIPESDAAQTWLRIGLILLPVALVVNLLTDVLWGQERWWSVIAVRLVGPVGLVVTTPLLYLTGNLTVETAAGLAIVVSVLPLPFLLSVLPGARRPHVDGSLMGEAVGFGLRAWPGSLSDLANQRLDQLLMIPLLPPRELGLYAVATTVAAVGTAPGGAVAAVIFPRIAGGHIHVLGPAFRVTVLFLALTQLSVALLVPFVLPVLFGASFEESIPLIFTLLPALLMTAVSPVLAHALAGSGYPGAGSVAQLIGLICTVVGLGISLPTLGATGAAITSLVAASAVLGTLLRAIRRDLAIPLRDFLALRKSDRDLAITAARALLPFRKSA